MAGTKPEYEGKAKLFMNGRSQAVRLPLECRFEDAEEVLIQKVGNYVILKPIVQSWADYFDTAPRADADFVESVISVEDPLPEDREPLD